MKEHTSCGKCSKSCQKHRSDTAKATTSVYMNVDLVGGMVEDSRNTLEWNSSGKIPNHLGKTVSVN